jgi:hypothetical protein
VQYFLLAELELIGRLLVLLDRSIASRLRKNVAGVAVK